jgi:uncharacterized protein (TIGR02466 family)
MAGMSKDFEIVPLFATPIVLSDLPDGPALCVELRKVIEQREKTHPGTQHSNLGGWQSTWDMDRWGGAPAIKLLALARNLANRVTTDREGKPVVLTWRANMWANVNRSGHGNEFHTHPGCYWSGSYYVDDGGSGDDPSLGGEFEMQDPRGVAPAMYAPMLCFATPGGRSAGASELIRPKAGTMVMFPAWLSHGVRPYRGERTRISLAFNLSL